MLRRRRRRPASPVSRARRANLPHGPLRPVAEVVVVRRGDAAVEDVPVGDPGQHQLLAVGRHQVDLPVARTVGPRHRRGRGWGATAAGQRPEHLVVDLVVRRVGAGTDEGVTRSGRAPSVAIARGRGRSPAAVPRQPAWTTASTRASGSTRAMGTQSATRMASVTPGSVVTRMSVDGDGIVLAGCPGPVPGSDDGRPGTVYLLGEDQVVELDAEGRGGPPRLTITPSGVVADVQARFSVS